MVTDSITHIVADPTFLKVDSVVHEDFNFSFERLDNSSFNEDLDSLKSNKEELVSAHIFKNHYGNYRTFTLEQDDGIFVLLLISFLCITRIYKYGTSFFTENMRLLFSSRRDLNLYSQTTINEFWFNFILIFQSVLLGAIIAFDYILKLHDNVFPQHSFYTIVFFIVGIVFFIGIKYGIYRLLGYVFNIKSKIDIWLRSYMLTIELLGIIAFIPVLILIYSQGYYNQVFVFLVALFLVSKVILFYRLVVFFIRSNINILFMIAYLCAIEIIPYIFLYNALVILYNIDITNLIWL